MEMGRTRMTPREPHLFHVRPYTTATATPSILPVPIPFAVSSAFCRLHSDEA